MITRSRTKKAETTVKNEREMTPPDVKRPRVDLARHKFVKVKDKDQDNENPTIQSPVFNIHIHMSPTLGENLPVSSMPSIHLHFDEISKTLGVQEKDVSTKSSKFKSKINSMFSVANTSFNEVLNSENSKKQKKISDKINRNSEIEGLTQQNEKKYKPVINNKSSRKKHKTTGEVGQSIVHINEFNDSVIEKSKNKNVDPSPHFKDKNKNKFDSVEKLNDLGQSTSTDVNIYSAEELPYNLKEAVVLLKDIFGRNTSNSSFANVSQFKTKDHECNSIIENKVNEKHVEDDNDNVGAINEKNSLSTNESSERDQNIRKFLEPSKILNSNSQEHVPNHLNNRSNKSHLNNKQQASFSEAYQELNNKEYNKPKNSMKKSEMLETPKSSKCLNIICTNGEESSNYDNKNVSADDQALLLLPRKKGDVYSEIYESDNENISKNNSVSSITEGCNFSEILKKIQNEKYRNQILSFANQQSTPLQKICSKENSDLGNLQKKKESSSQKKEEKTQCYSTIANNQKHKTKITNHEFKDLNCSMKAQITCNDSEDDKNEYSSDENEKSCNGDAGYDTSDEDEDTALESQHNNATIGSKKSDQTLDAKDFSEKEIVCESKKKKKSKLKDNDENRAESSKNSSMEKSLSIENEGEIQNIDISVEQIGEACNEISDFEMVCKKLSELQDGCVPSEFVENRLIDVAMPEIQLECINKEMVRRGIKNVSIKKKAHKKRMNKLRSQFRSPKSNIQSSVPKTREPSEPNKKEVSKPKKIEALKPETSKTSKKKFSFQEDYIPLKASGPTKFAVAPLDNIKPYEKHVAMSFKEKMLFGNRIKRFCSSNELQKLKMKQQIKRKP